MDVAAGKMYWLDTRTDKIQRASLDGSAIEDLVTTGLDLPRGLALLRTSAAVRYVATTGIDTGNDCTGALTPCATLAHAASQANSGDTIELAAGVYEEEGRALPDQGQASSSLRGVLGGAGGW